MNRSVSPTSAGAQIRSCSECTTVVSDRRRRYCPECKAPLPDHPVAVKASTDQQAAFNAALVAAANVAHADTGAVIAPPSPPGTRDIVPGVELVQGARRPRNVKVWLVRGLIVVLALSVAGSVSAMQTADEQKKKAQASLTQAQEENASMQERLRVLGNEKARLEDNLSGTEEAAKSLASLAVLATTIAGEMRECVNGMAEVALDALSGWSSSYAIDQMSAICDQAMSHHNQLLVVIDELLG